MSTVTAILEPDADGTVHVPVPKDLLGGKLQVTATLQAFADSDESHRRQIMAEALERIAARGGVASIPDPVAWQREQRKDRPLAGRND
ncbi:MAG TPA: hypothetical protein VKX17_08705 [Planctomycetota bacterium]|nr:hypothetical protein [Planctomycetota bacterium]